MAEGNHRMAASKPDHGLFVVPTPIGNLRDITLRALDVLGGVDLIACEDTRITSRLLNAYAIETPMAAYHEYNAPKMRPQLIQQLTDGGSIALVSDAGTPLVSDPGFKLVRSVIDANLPFTVLPGASASVTGLVISGLAMDRFLFAGFPPSRQKARQTFFREFLACPCSLIFFESAKRLVRSLSDMETIFGSRHAAVARELTKKFEEIQRGSLTTLVEFYGARQTPKGEIVVIIDPPSMSMRPTSALIDSEIMAVLANLGVKSAAEHVSDTLGLPRREIYQRALELRGNDKSE